MVSVSSSSNEMGMNLLRLLANDRGNDNLFLSPFSISVALAMTSLGAKGDTAAEMKKALCWKTDSLTIHKEFQSYIATLKKPSDSCILRTANRIYIEKEYPILQTFLNQTKELYLAEPVPAQFTSSPETERVNINTWVERQTEQKIKDLIPENVLSPISTMVLVNAIYFKGQWETTFDEKITKKDVFHVSSSSKKSVSMMHMTEELPYYKADTYAVLELPYKGGCLGMSIFLPDEQFGLEVLEKKLSLAQIKDSLSKLSSDCKIDVSLPKFEISSSFLLNEKMRQLGMVKAFSACEADFTGMSGKPDLSIDVVFHKAFLKVNEEGSEAAAATAVVMKRRCFIPAVGFKANHPFLVVIRDKSNDMILFLGCVVNPSEPN